MASEPADLVKGSTFYQARVRVRIRIRVKIP